MIKWLHSYLKSYFNVNGCFCIGIGSRVDQDELEITASSLRLAPKDVVPDFGSRPMTSVEEQLRGICSRKRASCCSEDFIIIIQAV